MIINDNRTSFVSLKRISFQILLILFLGILDVSSHPHEDIKEIKVREVYGWEDLVRIGEKVIFGSDTPRRLLSKGEFLIGKGQCPLCHQFFEEQKVDRCPNMMALTESSQKWLQVDVEKRSHRRIEDPRYQEAKKRHAVGEKDSGIVPHAETGGQYLIESSTVQIVSSWRGLA